MNTRRHFLNQLSIGTVGLIGGPAVLRAMSVERTMASSVVPEPWLEGLTARHRQFFDVPVIANGQPLLRAASFLDQYHAAYGLSDEEVTIVFGAHSAGLSLVLGDASWSKYDLGARFSVNDPATGAPAKRNHFSGRADGDQSPSVADLQKRGVRFLACRQTIARLSRDLAAQRNLAPEVVQADLLADLLPKVTPVPAMIVAVNRAQESGLTYVYIG